MKKIIHWIVWLQLFLSATVWAQEAFVVRRIEVDGLQNITAATVESYLPIKRGQVLRPAKTGEILHALYKTGFFETISLSKQDGTLIIHVVEHPTIGQLKVSGNSIIPKDKLTSVMTSLDIIEGRIYDPSILEKVKQSLLNQYYELGRFNARVDIKTTPLPRNRVSVNVTISEGTVAKVQRISIIGNHAFPESTLVKQLDLTTSGLFTFITQTDRYAEDKLEASMEKLRSYYMDHGYLRFDIKSSQAQITPDRKEVYISVVVDEGAVYTIERCDIEGNLILSRAETMKILDIKPGDVFSRQKIIDGEKAITRKLGDQGYLFARVDVRPQVNDKTHKVVLVFTVNPGKHVYVRHVTFSDNTRTNDVVLRREVLQMEGAPASTSNIEDSKQRLLLLSYIKEADLSIQPVPDTDDQVDVNYKVKEDNSAQATFTVGYSQAQHLILGVGFNQKNFFGTGNTLGINMQNSKYEKLYGIDFTNPYYTEDGISRSFNFLISRVDPGDTGVNNGYTVNSYQAGVLYGIPVGDERGVFSNVAMGASYQNILINLVPGLVSNQVNDFVTRHGRHYQEGDFKIGYSRDSRDKAIFPTSGMFQTAFFDAYAPLDKNSVSFYTFNYHGKWYAPITSQYILLSAANFGYGTGFNGAHNFPFFRNYYAGDIGSIRGYQVGTGPLDSKGKPYGGNILADASVGLIFPNYLSDNLRTNVFVDAGNAYNTLNNRSFGGSSTNSGPIRLSVGIEADLLTPFGPIEVSLADPINPQGKERQPFQFSMGASF